MWRLDPFAVWILGISRIVDIQKMNMLGSIKTTWVFCGFILGINTIKNTTS
jgi:hypothetical protein